MKIYCEKCKSVFEAERPESGAQTVCPKCGAQIKAYDNIPLFSYIILRGKCRNCKERISPRGDQQGGHG